MFYVELCKIGYKDSRILYKYILQILATPLLFMWTLLSNNNKTVKIFNFNKNNFVQSLTL